MARHTTRFRAGGGGGGGGGSLLADRTHCKIVIKNLQHAAVHGPTTHNQDSQ